MSTATIGRQYNDIVADKYDLDPQSVTGDTLDRAIDQIRRQHFIENGPPKIKVLDLGCGTGMFLERIRTFAGDQVELYGLDLSPKMVENAQKKIPGLVTAVDDAANFHAHFGDQTFDIICTHFITGFVPMTVLAPKIWNRLNEGGYWSLVAGTKGGFPKLQSSADSSFIRWMNGSSGSDAVNEVLCNPQDQAEVEQTLQEFGFELCQSEVFQPPVEFANMKQFMEFGYYGGWLIPIIERLGLHKAGALKRFAINRLIFPISDHHDIAVVLACKKGDGQTRQPNNSQ